MTAMKPSPSSSPRLPSPPPFTEVQIGPKSPTVNDSLIGPLPPQDDASTRRIRPGTKAVDMASGPPLIPLSQLDSPFQLQEHLKASYQNFTRPPNSSTVVPITRTTAKQLAEPPEGVERSLWLYELCRFLTMKANNIVIAFFAESPPCSAQTCPEMRASEWQYLCAVHDPPKACCAIDYCCHTLDWATNILTSPKFFPSRLTLGSEAAGGPQASMRHLTNIFRRVYRIFAHAWFQHREVFWQVEGHDGLYVFFKTVCDAYGLLPEDNYTIPAEAEGEEPRTNKLEEGGRKMMILRKEDKPHAESSLDSASTSLGPGATTRRHRHSPSTGAAVSTIAEAGEDEEVDRNTSNVSVLPPVWKKQEEVEKQPVPPVDKPSSAPEQTSENITVAANDTTATALPERLKDEERSEMTDTPKETPQASTISEPAPPEKDTQEREQDEKQAQTQEPEPEPEKEPETNPPEEAEPDSQHQDSSEKFCDNPPAEAEPVDKPTPEVNSEKTNEKAPEGQPDTHLGTEAESHAADGSKPPPAQEEEEDKAEKT
ncbi:hypothetical protein PRK78_005072 [Emydomyces testavorans]|uniref:Mob1 family protein n=1 Tax=Emydomyces testavorans TaxID=2070801 RepID=A0AAF0DJM3_9EURO|nr:hypothetical protein PRK78_005072 [Emydomyces testavorans]